MMPKLTARLSDKESKKQKTISPARPERVWVKRYQREGFLFIYKLREPTKETTHRSGLYLKTISINKITA